MEKIAKRVLEFSGIFKKENELSKITTKTLEHKLVENEQAVLLQTSAEKYAESTIELLKYMVNEKGMGGVYITVSRLYNYMVYTMKDANINTENLFFVDCVSQMGGGGEVELENCVFTSPIALSEIMTHTDDLLGKVKTRNKFIFLDCISTLLVYNKERSVKKVAMRLLTYVRLHHEVICILVTIQGDTPPKLLGYLRTLCDKVIEQ